MTDVEREGYAGPVLSPVWTSSLPLMERLVISIGHLFYLGLVKSVLEDIMERMTHYSMGTRLESAFAQAFKDLPGLRWFEPGEFKGRANNWVGSNWCAFLRSFRCVPPPPPNPTSSPSATTLLVYNPEIYKYATVCVFHDCPPQTHRRFPLRTCVYLYVCLSVHVCVCVCVCVFLAHDQHNIVYTRVNCVATCTGT